MRPLSRLVSGVMSLLLWAVVPTAVAAAAAPAAELALQKALAADASQTYSGTMMLFSWAVGTGEATAVRVRHRAPGQSRLEYLNSQREPYLVIVDDGTHHWEYYPDGRVASLEPSPDPSPADVEQNLDLLRHNYNLQYGGAGEVTGRVTDIVELVPRGCHQPSQRLWVDRETGVVLRTEQYRLDGSLAALSVFTGFQPVKSLPEELFRLKLPEGARVATRLSPDTPLKDLAAASGMSVRMPDELPSGYVYNGATVSHRDEATIVHLRFTDGLGVVSLFEQAARPFTRYRLSGAKPVELKSGRGWLHQECGGYVLNWTAGGINFTLVGEVPPEALVRMANSVPPGVSPGPAAYVRSVFAWVFNR